MTSFVTHAQLLLRLVHICWNSVIALNYSTSTISDSNMHRFEHFTVKLSRLISAHCAEENLIFTILCLKLITTLKVEKNEMGPSSGSKVPLNRLASPFCLSNVPGLVPEVKGTNGC